MRLMFVIAVTALLATGPAGVGARADPSASATDDVPPFVPARGDDQALAFAVSGLRLGSAQVAAGERIFGVCWRGGEPPYDLSLREDGGKVLLHERGLRADEVVKTSSPVALTPGRYFIELADAAGGRTEGRFQVVDAADFPVRADGGSPESRFGGAVALTRESMAFAFEAYLRIVDDAVRSPGSPADDLAHRLCHRS
jgi:hypothetical protein